MGLKDLFSRKPDIDRIAETCPLHHQAKDIAGTLYNSWRFIGKGDSPYNEFQIFVPLDEDGVCRMEEDRLLVCFGYNEVGDDLSRGFVHFDDYRRVLLRRRLDPKDFTVFGTEADGARGTAVYLGPLSRTAVQNLMEAFSAPPQNGLMPLPVVERKLAAMEGKPQKSRPSERSFVWLDTKTKPPRPS